MKEKKEIYMKYFVIKMNQGINLNKLYSKLGEIKKSSNFINIDIITGRVLAQVLIECFED